MKKWSRKRDRSIERERSQESENIERKKRSKA